MSETPKADILVVDDTPANLQLLTGMLKDCGYKVRAALNGELALQTARHSPPDLILLDITMPGLSGYDVATELKRDEALQKIPIIFISALTEPLDKVRAFIVGGVDYVTKPFHFEEVAARVATHLKISRLQCGIERSNENLRQTNDELRRLQELRDSLVHMIIHDMNSPLGAMIGFVGLCKSSGNIPPEIANYLGHAHSAATRLGEMVRSMLDISKMEAGQLKLHRTDCDLAEIVREIFAQFEPLRKNRRFEVDAPAQPLILSIDRDLITRVLQNLIGNALKYAPDGTAVRVALQATESAARVSVIDAGSGIPPEYHGRIFEKFGQVEKSGPRVGTGLGLTFCRLAIEAHGGRIGVDSEVGKGSTFWFEIPHQGK
ncbi:MAG TPA: hybrid sensor histidine kinase/response regulator [Chthoniobacteraceae bacterium]|nr:hybrid sensor histidine kinase/response regulator [Chthoniobacteraceae bacterium]